MADQIFWEHDTPIINLEGCDVDVPAWVDQNITPATVAAILEGGCHSGAYLPAVTYGPALATMAARGDDVLNFIEDGSGELPAPRAGISWSGIACFYLSTAVELWAAGIEMELSAYLEEHGAEGQA